jgi:hypothetical protein
MPAVELAGSPPPLAMIGLSQVRQLKIDRKSFGDLVSARQVHLGDDLLSLEHQLRRGVLLRIPAYGLAMLDQQSAQFLDGVEQILPGLLDEHLSEHGAERAHVPPQRMVFLRFARTRR